MKATVMYRAGDVHQSLPDAQIKQPTDALVRITQACICGSDLGRIMIWSRARRAAPWGMKRLASWRPLVPTCAK